jgi:D-psicose/D-tagatose/L-ribulose 3-epimerase
MVELDSPNLIGVVYSVVGRTELVPRSLYRQQWNSVVKNLRELCSYAVDRGRFISMEPINRFETDFMNTCDQGLRMIQDVNSPALKLLLDTFHMNIEEKDPAAAIRRAGRHLGHLHACGCDRGTPGNDRIDWPSIAAALKAINYQGDVVIESFTSDVKVLARAASIWREFEPTRNEIAHKGVKFLKNLLN